jgi:hypothetical protein
MYPSVMAHAPPATSRNCCARLRPVNTIHPPSSTGGDGAGAVGAGHTANGHIGQGGGGRAGLAADPTVVYTCQEVNWLLGGAACRWGALVCSALGNGAAVAGTAVRLGLVPWQLVQVKLEELVASRPVLIALQVGSHQAVVLPRHAVLNQQINEPVYSAAS